MGGQQALEWSIQQPDLISNLILVGTNVMHSPWGVAFNESQRMAIEADPTWGKPIADAGLNGMKTARAIALLSYRSYQCYTNTQSEEGNETVDNFKEGTRTIRSSLLRLVLERSRC